MDGAGQGRGHLPSVSSDKLNASTCPPDLLIKGKNIAPFCPRPSVDSLPFVWLQ